MICNCIAGQNDLIEWCRDHRLHHKTSETDADPHNSNRGWFFAHIGWLLQRKHPKVLEMGNKLDLSDLYQDPVLIFQKRHYWVLAFSFGLILLVIIYYSYLGESRGDSLSIGAWRSITSFTSDHGGYINLITISIDCVSALRLAHGLRSDDSKLIRSQTGETRITT